MITVRFSDRDELMAELAKSKQEIDRGIVRVTNLLRPGRLTPTVRTMSVVVTAAVRGQLIRFERYMGQLWGQGFEDRDKIVADAGHKIVEKISAECAALGLDVRAGILEDAADDD